LGVGTAVADSKVLTFAAPATEKEEDMIMITKHAVAWTSLLLLLLCQPALGQDAGDDQVAYEFEQRQIRFETVHAFDPYHGTWSSILSIREGFPGTILDGAAFYEKVGRPDLAERYESILQWKSGLTWGGVAAIVAGVLTASLTPMDMDLEGGIDSPDRTWVLVGAGLTVGGITAMVVGALLNPHPVTYREAHRMADDYNDSLRRELGLTVIPLVMPDGAGLSLAWRL
jgi:hypothetical protein